MSDISWLNPSERSSIIWDDNKLTTTEKAVLQAVSHCMMRENESFPSQTTIARMTSLTTRGIRKASKSLENSGIITRTNPNKSIHYSIAWDELASRINTSTDESDSGIRSNLPPNICTPATRNGVPPNKTVSVLEERRSSNIKTDQCTPATRNGVPPIKAADVSGEPSSIIVDRSEADQCTPATRNAVPPKEESVSLFLGSSITPLVSKQKINPPLETKKPSSQEINACERDPISNKRESDFSVEVCPLIDPEPTKVAINLIEDLRPASRISAEGEARIKQLIANLNSIDLDDNTDIKTQHTTVELNLKQNAEKEDIFKPQREAIARSRQALKEGNKFFVIARNKNLDSYKRIKGLMAMVCLIDEIIAYSGQYIGIWFRKPDQKFGWWASTLLDRLDELEPEVNLSDLFFSLEIGNELDNSCWPVLVKDCFWNKICSYTRFHTGRRLCYEAGINGYIGHPMDVYRKHLGSIAA